MTWHLGRLAAFDVESTSVDVETARIVTASVVRVGAGHATHTRTWLLDPAVDIPPEAAAIHGIDTAYAREHGITAAAGVELICEEIVAAIGEGLPLVAFNLSYDATVLDRECRRHDLPTLDERLGSPIGPCLDGMVLDRHCDRYRKGSRKLRDVCAHYGVRLHGAHDCGWDALAAARLVTAIAEAYPEIAAMPLADLHALQVAAKAEQAASFADYLRRQGKPADDVRGEWPILPVTEAW